MDQNRRFGAFNKRSDLEADCAKNRASITILREESGFIESDR
jgi:hypothetical protein